MATFQHYNNKHRAHLSLKGSTPYSLLITCKPSTLSSTTIRGNHTAMDYILLQLQPEICTRHALDQMQHVAQR